MNALEWNRDLSRPIDEIRRREAGLSHRADRNIACDTVSTEC